MERLIENWLDARRRNDRVDRGSSPVLSQCVTYEILARADGSMDITVTTTTGYTVRREDLATYAEARAVLQDLRIIAAALGCDLVQTGGSVLA